LLGRFEFHLALLKEFNIVDFFVIRCWLQVHKKDREGELGYMMLDIIDIGHSMT
jgi:hypothetical protein